MDPQASKDNQIKEKLEDFSEIRKKAEGALVARLRVALNHTGIASFSIILVSGIGVGFWSGYEFYKDQVAKLEAEKDSSNLTITTKSVEINQLQSSLKIANDTTKEREKDTIALNIDNDRLKTEISSLESLSPEDIIFNQLFAFKATGIRSNTYHVLSNRFKISVDKNCSLTIFDSKQSKPSVVHVQDLGTYDLKFGEQKIQANFRYMGGISDGENKEAYRPMDICFFTFLKQQN